MIGQPRPNASDTLTVCSVFVNDPDKKLHLSLTCPTNTGRNFSEILHMIDALQLTDGHKVATPVNWTNDEAVIIVPSVKYEEAKQFFPNGFKTIKPYLRLVAQPKG